MAGLARSSRVGKRHASSTSMSSFSYYVTIVVFVAFCIVGVWMVSSSNVSPPRSTTAARVSSFSSSKSGASRIVAFRDPPLDTEEDSQSSLHEISTKGNGDSVDEDEKSGYKISSLREWKGSDRENEGEEDGSKSIVEDESKGKQEAEEVDESPRGGMEEKKEDEEGKKSGDLDGGTEEEGKRLSEEATHELELREHDDQLPSGGDGDGDGEGNKMHQPQQIEGESQEEQTHEEHQRQHDEQLPQDSQEEQIQEENQRQRDEQLPGDSQEVENQEEQQKQQDERLPGDREEDNQQGPLQTALDNIAEEDREQVEEKIRQVTNENGQETNAAEEGQQEKIEEESLNEGQQHQQAETGENSEDQQHQSIEIGGDEEGQQQQQPSERQMEEESSTEPREVNKEPQSDESRVEYSDNNKERRKEEDLRSIEEGGGGDNVEGSVGNSLGEEWKLCNVTAGADYIPCLDNEKAIKKLHNLKHFQHRERHCPEESPTCLVPLPVGYRRSIEWPKSRDRIWYNNVPRTKLAEVKGHQNWVKVAGDYLTFPGGGTQFIHGALHYIDFIQQSVRGITWGKHTRVILDVGCGVASFGGYLFDRDVLAMSFAPKDEHEAQVQFALERGIPAISAVMGSQRLPFPSNVFDVVHCARCRVPWHAEGGTLLLELNRVLRPGGFFVWSATPVYQKLQEDVEIWKAMRSLTASMCWELVAIRKDRLNSVGAAFFRKPVSNECYDKRKTSNPPMCKETDNPNAAWYIPLETCMHRVPVERSERGSQWPKDWPLRLQVPPSWLNSSQTGVYGKPAPVDFKVDYEHWKRVVEKSYLSGLGINWSRVRNVMDMRSIYGGFAAALKDLKIWVMNVVNVDGPDTLPIIYERGLFGIYHDWCESFSTYPRTYDLLHADHLFSSIKKRCDIVPLIAEVDRIVRPGGKIIVRDDSATASEVESLLKSLHWNVRLTFSKNREGVVFAEKSDWRPNKLAAAAA
ncbi:probable methyltransferase PMT24 [Zingiber officinale]|uniref:probable methyltransferase PMT24 n=1 Tax=Zingiber officinale TaxID=94328 RepID=UPI001C4A8008|nr:probable methyltransferase PMT24 [Zingiber officinale]